MKPTNVSCDAEGRLRLLDFGIIRSLREPGVTRSDARFVGTYRYAAPEYISDGTYDYRSDLYSFGATLYFLLHGRELFHGVNRTADLLRAKEKHELRFDEALTGSGPIWSAALDLCRVLLAKSPDARPSSALACVDQLAATVPLLIPLRTYYACALSKVAKTQETRAKSIGFLLKECGTENGYAVYMPGEHTPPLVRPWGHLRSIGLTVNVWLVQIFCVSSRMTRVT